MKYSDTAPLARQLESRPPETWDGNERRQYFRLDDRVLLGIEVLAIAPTDDPAVDSLVELEQQITSLLHRVSSQQPEVAALLRLMNQKLNRVAGLELQTTIDVDEHLANVNLSACGIRFETHTDVSEAHYLRLHLTLLPDHTTLVLNGRIVALEAGSEPDSTRIRVAFNPIRNTDQEILIQHMMSLQRRQIRPHDR
ncbi:PilZ domain-containing protein [Oceanobacter antarcticus]|mgnify:FL=1|uniref:PilZ domain-containing protein n=1 Tax=Oceanobacter antarcticus TaxID=3133425 RepID=A0ABW8NNA5_9GAMM